VNYEKNKKGLLLYETLSISNQNVSKPTSFHISY